MKKKSKTTRRQIINGKNVRLNVTVDKISDRNFKALIDIWLDDLWNKMSFCHAMTTHKDNPINTQIKRLRLESKSIFFRLKFDFYNISYQYKYLI